MVDKPLLRNVALGSGATGLLFHLIAFATPYWGNNNLVHHGLWKFCPKISIFGISGCADIPDALTKSWFEAVQAFAILGFLAGAAGIVLTFLYMFVEQLKKDVVYAVAAVGNLAAAGCIFLAVVIFASNTKFDQSWSFGLSIVGMIFHGVAGVLMGVYKCQNRIGE